MIEQVLRRRTEQERQEYMENAVVEGLQQLRDGIVYYAIMLCQHQQLQQDQIFL